MILYSVCTTYHLLEAIVHKCNYKKNDKAILFISSWLRDKYEWYSKLIGIFEQIIVFDGHYEVDENVESELNAYYEKLFLHENINIKDFTEINVYGAEHSFGAYIAINHIPYLFWEEGAGALGKGAEMREYFLKHHGEKKFAFQKKYALESGEDSCVLYRYYDRYFQENEVIGSNLVHFDLAEELMKMDIDQRNEIVNLFYGEGNIETKENTSVILTENLANTDVLTWNEQILLYQYMIDYFLPNYNLFIKPHPDDLLYYEKLFDNIAIVRKKFPAELLPFIFKRLPECIATASSTAIYGFRNIFSKVLEFNFEFTHRKEFLYLNRYFVALSIVNHYLSLGWKLNLIGVNQCIINNFSKFCNIGTQDYRVHLIENLENANKGNIWLIDNIKLENQDSVKVCNFLNELPDKNIVIFINSNQQYGFYNYYYKKIWEKITPIEIYVEKLEEKDKNLFEGPSIIESGSEIIYCYGKEKLDMDSVKRELPHVGISLSANELDGDKKQIKLLEGMLEATEKRLLYYMEKEKEGNTK